MYNVTMDKQNFSTFVAHNSKIKQINFNVFLVSRASFNDERLIAELALEVEELTKKPLQWFDLYLGKRPGNKTKIAFSHLDGDTLFMLCDDGDDIFVVEKEGFMQYFADDYDKGHLISTQIWCAR